jgi:ABC-type transporter MlaC component
MVSRIASLISTAGAWRNPATGISPPPAGVPSPDGVIVTSRIIPEQGAPIAVDWRLGISDGSYKIEDVDIDGVTMALAQRSEMTALIAHEGGEVGTLLAVMR